MHFYIYDEKLSQPKYANALAEIETRLTDLELQGRIGRLGPLKSAKEMVRQAIRGGAKTIVAVGTDRTIAETINAVAGTDIALGVIPIGEPGQVANLLGIPEGEEAAVILAARKIEIVDLGKINNLYFLTSATVEADEPITIECDERYTVSSPKGLALVTISNLQVGAGCQDGYLEATIESSTKQWFRKRVSQTSLVPFRQGRILTDSPVNVLVENTYTVKLPTTIEIIPKTLKVIVGKNRAF